MRIHPHVGVDGLTFGMTRDDVARAVHRVPKRGRRNQFDSSDYDLFEDLGFFAYYDAHDKCEAVEFSRDADVEYDNYRLFSHPASEVRAWAEKLDPGLERADGFVSKKLGLMMYAPLIDEADLDEDEKAEPAQSFIAFKPGSGKKS
jgi:hypothetical protein